MDNTETEFWIENGVIIPRPKKPDGSVLSDRFLLHAQSLVRLDTSSKGTIIRWVMFGSNWSSLFFLNDFIMACTGPITLRYFNAGWFEETVSSCEAARQRLETLTCKSDIRFAQRTYVEKFDTKTPSISPKLKSVIESSAIEDKDAVVCHIDIDREITTIENVGDNSALAKVYGISPVSFPCQTGHSYDRVVSRSYYEAVKSGRPIYDHVLASMVRPDGEVTWMGYQRLIVPEAKKMTGSARVKVVSELADVDIKLL
jgi:hypothetical protein